MKQHMLKTVRDRRTDPHIASFKPLLPCVVAAMAKHPQPHREQPSQKEAELNNTAKVTEKQEEEVSASKDSDRKSESEEMTDEQKESMKSSSKENTEKEEEASAAQVK